MMLEKAVWYFLMTLQVYNSDFFHYLDFNLKIHTPYIAKDESSVASYELLEHLRGFGNVSFQCHLI